MPDQQHPAPTAPPAPDDAPRVVALTGNPRAGSRTHAASVAVARRVAALLSPTPGTTTVGEVDLSGLAGQVLAPDAPDVDAALAQVATADVVVVATPVHKASFTGLLKAFLDRYGPDALRGVVAVPLVVPGTPAHALVGEAHLRPVLVELGAVVPTRAVVVTADLLTDPGDGRLDAALDTWLDAAAEPLRRLVRPAAEAAPAVGRPAGAVLAGVAR